MTFQIWSRSHVLFHYKLFIAFQTCLLSMYSVHLFVFCHICVAQTLVIFNSELLYDILHSKQVMQNPKQQSQLHTGIGTKDFCHILYPRKGMSEVHRVDFRETYTIILIKFNAFTTGITAGRVFVFIDNRLCAQPNLINGSNMLSCSNYLKGRVLAIKTYMNITVCSLSVFTCAAGKRGHNCTEMCEDGTYGVGCKPCSCRSNNTCRKSDGLCQSGCQGNTVYKNYDCYYRSVSKRKKEHFEILTNSSAIRFMFSSSTDVGQVYPKTKNESHWKDVCKLYKSDQNRSIILQIPYKSSVVIYSVVITYCQFVISPPYSIHITIDGNSCFGTTKYTSIQLGSHTFICQRKGIKGNVIKISHTSHAINAKQVIGFKAFRVLGCTKGFYGPKCKLPCNCQGLSCNSETGYCPTQLCQPFRRGRNCASVNAAAYNKILVKSDTEDPLTVEKLRLSGQPTHVRLPRSSYDLTLRRWVSWWAIELDGVYQINSVTLHIEREQQSNFREFAVFIDTETLRDRLRREDKHTWKGLGCTRNENQHVDEVMDVSCVGPARTITVVTYDFNPYISADVKYAEVWTCMEGTFGPLCEGICNCKDEDEACDKVTGLCISGCADGYRDIDCQSPCLTGTEDDNCWKTCQCRDSLKGCGPGVRLCPNEKCQPGWIGVSCDIPCPEGWYGLSCTEACGQCKYDYQNLTCNPNNGRCPGGCTNNLQTLTCKEERIIQKKKSEFIPDTSEAFNTFKIIIYALVVCLLAVAVSFICIRLWPLSGIKTNDQQLPNAEGLKNQNIKDTIMREHRDYHESFMQRRVLFQSVRSDANKRNTWIKSIFPCGWGPTRRRSTPKAIFGVNKVDIKRKSNADDRCKPLEDNTQQNAEHKVALWILKEDFNELIDRRKERLQNYVGNILDIEESTYAISTINLTKEELDKLYDEVGVLAIP